MAGGAGAVRRYPLNRREHLRLPHADGPLPATGGGGGLRCPAHRGAAAVEAARTVAEAARQRAAAGRRRQVAPPATPMSDAQIAALAEALNRHGVRYVCIGGAAAQLHGAPVPRTRDVDVVPERTGPNLDRLAAALRNLGARLWVGPGEPEGVEVPWDATILGRIEGFLNLLTDHGPLDVTYRPEGTDGYEDLARAAVAVQLLGVEVPVAALEDVIRSKEAAGRAKDLAVLPGLVEFLRRRSRE